MPIGGYFDSKLFALLCCIVWCFPTLYFIASSALAILEVENEIYLSYVDWILAVGRHLICPASAANGAKVVLI